MLVLTADSKPDVQFVSDFPWLWASLKEKGNRQLLVLVSMQVHKASIGSGVYTVMVRETKNSPKKTSFGRRRWIIFSAILVIIIILGFVFSSIFLQHETKFPLNAVIIDQLEADFPNQSFVSNVTSTLQNHGFNVTYYNRALDVSFFENLAFDNYGLIILRAHSALRNDSATPTVDLFTSETYDQSSEKYTSELNSGLLTVGEYFYKPGQYFALSSQFIEKYGHFPSSIVIAMGCQSLKPGSERQMPQAFLDKGAKAYIGWSDIVFPHDTDDETMRLISLLFNENRTIGDAVRATSPHTYSGTPYPNSTEIINVTSYMRFYPQSNEHMTISQLVAESGDSTRSSTSSNVTILSICFISSTPRSKRPSRRKNRLGNQFLVTSRNRRIKLVSKTIT